MAKNVVMVGSSGFARNPYGVRHCGHKREFRANTVPQTRQYPCATIFCAGRGCRLCDGVEGGGGLLFMVRYLLSVFSHFTSWRRHFAMSAKILENFHKNCPVLLTGLA